MMSLVMMAALATSTEVPDMGRRGGGGQSCGSSYGGGYSSCGSGYGGGYNSCGSGYGGGYGGYSSCGSGYGGYGGYAAAPSYCGSGYCGGGYAAAPSYCGSGYCGGGYTPAPSYCNTGYCGGGYMPAPSYCNTGYCGGGFAPWQMTPGKPEDKPKTDKEEISVPATILVSVPADAKLTVDGLPTKQTAASRTFTTPELKPGRTFAYTLKAEFMKDGDMVKVEKVVTFKAGQEVKISLEGPTSVAAR